MHEIQEIGIMSKKLKARYAVEKHKLLMVSYTRMTAIVGACQAKEDSRIQRTEVGC